MGRVHHRKIHRRALAHQTDEYSQFDQLNGKHSWQTSVEQGCVLYPVRKLNAGEVTYFNFKLAKEMGLIPKSHPHHLTKKLEKKILDTFSIRIINEWDQKQNIRYHPSVLKPHPYMATRYLQLQHKNKSGKTSGDGRSVWNGEVRHGGACWDVSSRGTGVTRLAPGAVEANKPLKSGSTAHGYGCGLADIDELIAWVIMSEIFHNNSINTERPLAVIDLGDGNGIGVRVGKNLIRPAHLFTHLKQSQYESLKQATDYLIERQHANSEWGFGSLSRKKYTHMLRQIAKSFGQFAAQLDRHYIFAWLDWDGDNVLANAGIIDYGSIRQFGLRHDEYRYDDVDRFSTNLKEQKKKARQIVQVFAQLTDYLETGRRKPISRFARHWSLQTFDASFENAILENFLGQLGVKAKRQKNVMIQHRKLVRDLFKSYSVLEGVKTRRRLAKVPDGVNRPAILNMRSALYGLPQHYLGVHPKRESISPLPTDTFFSLVLATSARGRDRKPAKSLRNKIRRFQQNYCKMVSALSQTHGLHSTLESMAEIAFEANRPDRMTGDALLNVVDEALKFKRRGGDNQTLQQALDNLIALQSPPDVNVTTSPEHRKSSKAQRAQTLFESFITLIDGYKESI